MTQVTLHALTCTVWHPPRLVDHADSTKGGAKMRITDRVLTIGTLGLTLAACGGGGSSAAPPKPASVASEIGCSGYADDTTQEIFVQAVGKCTINGDDTVRVLTFNDNTGRDSFVKTAKGFGGNYAVGDRVAVEATSTTVDALDGKAGLRRA